MEIDAPLRRYGEDGGRENLPIGYDDDYFRSEDLQGIEKISVT